MKVMVMGAAGRMGVSILRLAHEAPDVEIVGACDAPTSPHLGRDTGELIGVGPSSVRVSADLDVGLAQADVCIDFSSPAVFPVLAQALCRHRVAWVCGVTGLTAAAEATFDAAAHEVPVLWAANMSAGIQVLAELVEEAAAKLGWDFDIEITETHHHKKKDAPSGTALRLADAVRAARPATRLVTGREGLVGERAPEETAVFALRGGDVIGDHTVHFFGRGERLELTHRATNRDLFAHGALRAARFLQGKPAGRYTIADVVRSASPSSSPC